MAQARKKSASARPRASQGGSGASHDPVLALTTGGEALGKVDVDGQVYDMADPKHFSLREFGWVQRAMDQVVALEQKAARRDTTAKDERDYLAALVTIAHAAAPDVPMEVWPKMGASQLGDLALAFFGLLALRSPRLSLLKRLSTDGPTPSQTSRGSTASLPSEATG